MFRKILALFLLLPGAICIVPFEAYAGGCPSPVQLVDDLTTYNNRSLQALTQPLPDVQGLVNVAVNEIGTLDPGCLNLPLNPPLQSCSFSSWGALVSNAQSTDNMIASYINDIKASYAPNAPPGLNIQQNLENILAEAQFEYQSYSPCVDYFVH